MMPLEISLLLEASRENPAIALSGIASQGWEAVESIRNPAWAVALLNQNEGVQTGYYDKFVSLDIQANRLGALAGVASLRAEQDPRRGREIIEVFNHPVVTRPLKDEWHPQVSMDFALPIAA
jgi:hypothetical protein